MQYATAILHNICQAKQAKWKVHEEIDKDRKSFKSLNDYIAKCPEVPRDNDGNIICNACKKEHKQAYKNGTVRNGCSHNVGKRLRGSMCEYRDELCTELWAVREMEFESLGVLNV